MKKTKRVIAAVTLAFASASALLGSDSLLAAGGKVTDPNGTAPDRYVYYPGTEKLAKDEIRLFACGTGLPATGR